MGQSAYEEHQQEKERDLQAKCEQIRKHADSLTAADERASQQYTDKMVRNYTGQLEQAVSSGRAFMHIDMDAFYAQVEERDFPELVGRPIAVGHPRSVVSTSNYEARRYGVRSAMAGFKAREACPDLVFRPVRMAVYVEVSREVETAFAEVDPHYEMGSLDEASLDITAHLAAHPTLTPDDVCRAVRARVLELTRLTCSAGSGLTRLVAKIASDRNKPNGQFSVPLAVPAHVAFFDPLPVRSVTGIGRVTERILQALSITDCSMIRTRPRPLSALPISTRAALIRVSLGVDRPPRPAQSRSAGVERTVAHPLNGTSVRAFVEGLCGQLARRMEADGEQAASLTFKWKDTSFGLHTRQTRMAQVTADAGALSRTAHGLVSGVLVEEPGFAARLVGVTAGLADKMTEGSRLKAGLTAPAAQQALACPICGLVCGSEAQVDTHLELGRCGRGKAKKEKARARGPKRLPGQTTLSFMADAPARVGEVLDIDD